DGAPVVAGRVVGSASINASAGVVNGSSAGFQYAVAASAGTLKLYDNQTDLLQGRPTLAANVGDGGYWAVQLPGDGTYAVGLGFAPNVSFDGRQAAEQAARDAASVSGAQQALTDDAAFWDDYLSRVPVPADYSIQGVDALGVTTDEVRLAYYRAW